MLRKARSVLKTRLRTGSVGCLILSAVLFYLMLLPNALRAAQVDVSQYVTVTTANERSTMDRRTRMITSTADVTLTNSSQESISVPFHAAIEIFDTAYSSVNMPDAQGGYDVEPYGKYYYDLSSMLPAEGLVPGQSVTFKATFVRFYTVRFRYNVIPYGSVAAGPENQSPTADAGQDAAYALGYDQTSMAVTLDGSGSADADGSIAQYIWSGTPEPASEVSPSVTLAEGTYTFTLVVIDDDGAQSDPDIVTIIIEPAPNRPPTADAGGPYSGIVGQEITFDGSQSIDPDGDPLNYTWDFGDGETAESMIAGHSYGAANTYTVTLFVDDGYGGGDTVTLTLTITASNLPPVADAGGPYSTEINQSIQFDGSGSSDPDGDSLTFAWNFGDNTTDNGETPHHTYTAAGTYTVTLTVSDGRGGTDIAQVQVVISTINLPPQITSSPVTTVDEGMAYSYQAIAEDPNNDTLEFILFQGPEGAVIDPETGLFTWSYPKPGTFEVEIAASDGNGGTDVQTFTLVVVEMPNRPPSADAGGPYAALVGQEINFDGTGSIDPDNDALTFYWDFGDGTTGTGEAPVHSYSDPGTYLVALIVADPEGASHTSQTQATIEDINHPPALQAIEDMTVKEGQSLSIQIAGSDPDNDPISFSHSQLPEGAVFDANTRILSWTPTYDQSGSYPITFTVTDPEGLLDSDSVIITVTHVNRAPLLDPVSERVVSETRLLTFQISGRDPDGDTLTYAASNLPQGAEFDAASQIFSWTPPDGFTGTYQVGFTAKDAYLSAAISVRILVNSFDAGGAPALTSIGSQQVDEGQPLVLDIIATDPQGEQLSYTATGLPAGATFDPAAPRFSWIPDYSQAGFYTVNFTATDPGGLADTINVDIRVNNVNRQPVLDPQPERGVAETKLLTFQLTGSDPDGDDLTYAAGALPAGALFEPATQTFSWTPTAEQAGGYSVEFSVTDGDMTGSATASIRVTDFIVDRTPSLTPVSDQEIDEGQELSFQVTANDPNGEQLAWTTQGLPDGATFDPTTDNVCGFSWTPTYEQAGIYVVTITVSDPGSLSDLLTVRITVVDVNRPPVLDSVADRQVNEGVGLAFQLSADDPDGDSIAYSAEGLPAGAVMDPAAGAFSWTPTFEQAGTYQITFAAGDGAATAQQAASIEVVDVNRPPVILTAALPDARIDQDYKFKIAAADPDKDPLTYAITGATADIHIDAVSGELSWNPSHADIGAYTLTVQVADGRGGSDAKSYSLAVPDTIPPVVFLNLPKQANPGTSVNAELQASDNVAVAAVAVGSERTDLTEPYSKTVSRQKMITLPSQLGPATVQAFAWDSSGNRAEAVASIEIVAAFDTTPPQVALRVSPEAAPGQLIRLTAVVSDDVGVETVTFFAGNETIGTTSGRTPWINYQVPDDAAISSTIVFQAQALDFSGNSAGDEAASTVVGSAEADTTPPEATAVAADTVVEGETLSVTVAASNETCLAQIDVYVNHSLAASYLAPDQNTFEVVLPAGLEPGMSALVEVVITDCAGNQTFISADNRTSVAAAGKGVVAGEVYNDRTGLPLEGARVVFAMGDDVTVAATTDEKGRFSLVAKAGAGRLLITKDGFTAVERTGVQVTENQGIEMVDARLTPSQDAEQAVSSAIGSTVKTPFSLTIAGYAPVLANSGLDSANIAASEIKCEIPAGATGTNRAFALTQISPQGLRGILPGGWSPLAALNILPRNISFQSPAVLTISNILGYTDAHGIVLVGWDETGHSWRVVAAAAVSADGSTISSHVSQTGQYAFLLPDSEPASPPAVIAGEPLPGVLLSLVPDQVTTVISPKPQVIFYRPGVHSDVGLSMTTGTGSLTSGTPVQITLTENFNFYSGDNIITAPCVQDIFLYSFSRPALFAAFPVTPSFEFEALSLKEGIIDVDAYAPIDTQRGLMITGPSGGALTTADGASLLLDEESVPDYVAVELETLAEDDLEFQWPDGMAYVSGVAVGFSGSHLALPALLSTPVPQGFVDQGQLLLVRLDTVQGASRLVLVGRGELQGDTIVSAYSFSDDPDVRLPGIADAGRYLFVQTDDAVGFISGRIFDTTGSAFEGAVVTTDTLPVVALSQSSGEYVTAGAVSAFTAMALDPVKMDSGTASGAITAAGTLVYVDVALVEAPPQVVSFSPVDGQQNVPLGTAVSLTFSEPLDAATVTPGNFILTGPAGPVLGTLSPTANNTRVMFRPADPLVTDRTYVFSVMTGVRDLAGYPLEEIFSFSFTTLDTTPPPPPPAGSINATIPGDNRQTTITTTQGTAGVHDTVSVINKTQGTSTPVLVEADGSFSVNINADIIDEVVISITDPTGNETVAPVGPFRNPDGSIGVGPQGAQIEANNGAVLNIPQGAFPNGAVVRFTGLTEAEIGINPGPNFPFVLGFEIQCSVAPEIYLNVSAPMSAGVNPDVTGIVARVVDVYGGKQALAIVDTAKIIDGRLTTSSPPCPGLAQRAGRYGMFLNEDERMAMAQSLISIVATGMHNVTIQALIESINGDLGKLYEFIAFAGNSGHALNEMYEQTCLPVPPDTPLQVVIRDAETREALDILDIDPIEPFQFTHFHASVYYADTNDNTAPAVIGTNPVNRVLDGYNKRIEIRFSEPIDHMSLLGAGLQDFFLTAEDDSETVYRGTWQLSENNTLLVFEANKQLPLGKKFRLHLENIKDLAGNSCRQQPIIFTTFKPQIIFPTASRHLNRADIAAVLGIDEQNIPEELWFKDVDFITRSPDESYDGKWHTTLAAIQGGLNWGGNIQRLFTLDLSDPTAPAAKGGSFTDARFYQSRIRLLDNTAILPREDSWADPQFWKRRLLYYQASDPSIRLCIDPTDSEQEIYDQWVEKNCRPEDGGCSVINGGCGDIAVTTVYDGKYSYLWTYDVTNDDEFKWASSRLLSDNGDPRRYEAPAGMGFPQGISVLKGMDIPHGDLLHQNTVGVYVATQGIGLELVDLGLNIPTISDQERESSLDYPWGYAETLQWNAQLYYRDVAVVPSRTKADNTVIAPKVVAIASDSKDGTDIKTLEIFRADLAGEPTGIKPLTRLPNHLAVAADIPVYETSETNYYDLALITTESGGMYIYEIPEDGSLPQKSQFFVDTPAGVVTNYIEVDSDAMLAYVGATNINEITGGDGLLIIDISEPFTFREDEDGDGWNDRIIGRLPITLSGYAGPVKLNGFRVDRERGLVYAGVKADGRQALVIVKVRNCPDLSIDFKAIPEPAPAPEQVEKSALVQIISAGLSESGMPAGSVAVLAYGEKACLWKEGCRNNDSNDRQYRFAVLIPESEWGNKDFLLAKLYEQVIGPDGGPKSIETLGFEVTFENIEFIPVKYEEFITANIGLDPVAEDYGLAKQAQLLEWLLTGAYVEGPSELRQPGLPLDLIITLLADTCDQGECVTDEPSHVWRQEGFELAKLQEAEVFKSGALIRFHGESETDTTLHAALQEDLQQVSKAAIRAVLAKLIANEEGNRFLAFQADTYKGFGPGILTHDSLDPGAWETTLDCNSFEHWVASITARTVQENLGIFTIEEIISEVYDFQKIADGEKQFGTAEEANAFIAMAYQYIHDVTSGFVWSIYQAKLLNDANQAQRSSNMAALEARIFELQQNGQKEIRPRFVNKGPENVDDIWIRMYEAAAGSGAAGMAKETQLNLKAGSEMHPPEDTFVLGGIRQIDPSVNGWCSVLVDIPEKTVREADRENNWGKLFFYVLDPANPVVPALPPEPDLPVEDPQASLLEGDPACICRSPELNISVSSNGLDTLELNPGDCADVDVRVVNTGNEALRNVRLYSTLPGIEDWTHDITQIGPGQEIIATFQYCVPVDESNDLAGYVWFEEMDEEYEPPPAESNLLHIDITRSLLNVDAKANGKDEIFVGKGWDVTFSVDFDQTNCSNPRYFWDLGDAKGLLNDQGGSYSYDEGGTYRAKARVSCDERFEEDIVNVHVVDVEILVNNTLDEVDDVVRLKAEFPNAENQEDMPTKIFTTPFSVRLKKPLLKAPRIKLTSPGERIGFTEIGAAATASDTIRELTIPKNCVPVEFAISGESASEMANDASIIALLEDPGPPVGEEDITVFWFDFVDIEVTPTADAYYGFHEVIPDEGTDDETTKLWYHAIGRDEQNHTFEQNAVTIRYTATIRPQDIDCSVAPLNNLRIGVIQNLVSTQIVRKYTGPEINWRDDVPAGTTAYAPEMIRESLTIDRTLNDTMERDEDNHPLAPLFTREELLQPAGCTDRFDRDTEDNPGVEMVLPDYTRPDYPKPRDAQGNIVGDVRYRYGNVSINSHFRTWVVTFDVNTEEIIPLKETTWKVEVDSELVNQRAEVEQTNQDPTVSPVVNPPYANDYVLNPELYTLIIEPTTVPIVKPN